MWWYIDALSDDGTEGLTLIGFLGSVFSPYYAWSGRKDPLDHCALNVALYRPGRGGRWAMTERSRGALERTPDALRIGPSSLAWDGDALRVEVNEICSPLPRKLKGQVRLAPEFACNHPVKLDNRGAHHWSPLAPRCRVEVNFDDPDVRWTGVGYLDSNWGSSALESAFVDWTWSRAPLGRGAAILYDARRREGGPLSVALRFDPSGRAEPIEQPTLHPLPSTGWRVARSTRSEDAPSIARTLEDTPFYARSVVRQRLAGEWVQSVHESLSLNRFRSRWVKMLLPFRMPRNGSA